MVHVKLVFNYTRGVPENIASVSRGRMYSESRRVSGIKNK